MSILTLKKDLTILSVIALWVAVLFYQVNTFEFINFDDDVYVSNNPYVLAGLSWDGVKWAFSTSSGGHWHPLSWISHMLDISLFGPDAGRLHLANVFFHVANACLLYLILSTLLQSRIVGFWVAILFAVHPMRLESVAWISQRKDLLSMFFGLLSIFLYLAFVRGKSKIVFASALISLTLALLAKPTMVSIPVLLLLLDFWPLRRITAESLKNVRSIICNPVLHEKSAFFALGVLFCVGAVLSQSSGGGLRSIDEVSITQRLSGVAPSYLAYLGKLFWPSGLIIFYPRVTYLPGVVAGAFVSLLIITYFFFHQRRLRPQLLFGWLWFLISLLPMIGLVSVGGQAFADRWTYLAHIGPIIALVYLGFQASPKITSWVCALITSIFTCVSYSHLPEWRSSEAIFAHALEVVPDNFMAHTNLGTVQLQRGNTIEATKHFEEAIRLNPTYPEALNNWAIVRAQKGRFPEALEALDKALAIRPDFEIAQANRNKVLQSMQYPENRGH